MRVGRFFASWVCCVVVSACADEREGDTADADTMAQLSLTGGGSGGSLTGAGDSAADDDGVEKLDVGATGGAVDCPEGQVCDDCVEVEHTPCDGDSTDPFRALGLNCDGESQIQGTLDGNPLAIGLRTGFGGTMQWAPREGSKFVVLGSGFVSDLDSETPGGDLDVSPTHCNDDLGAFDPGGSLPMPVRTNDVGGDCTANDALLGTGDCSNTIQSQFSQGVAANDYTEMRVVGMVPPSNNSISYDLAFFSVEYPFYYGSQFNDMYVGWLESESWTGNISFDEMGNPISLNAGFLAFRDDGGNRPEFAGTCMRQHAGTKWLNSTAPVTPGEQITVVFAIFDLSDSILDSYVFLDNFHWGCEGTDHPMTTPVG
ncbi:MAG: choice-of-anchor L domain-containing protein [Deltaproteobacteria bacterium]|nr:choice-of-anchor L domain-containing protein [Deltaproteobacteria bacterium]